MVMNRHLDVVLFAQLLDGVQGCRFRFGDQRVAAGSGSATSVSMPIFFANSNTFRLLASSGGNCTTPMLTNLGAMPAAFNLASKSCWSCSEMLVVGTQLEPTRL